MPITAPQDTKVKIMVPPRKTNALVHKSEHFQPFHKLLVQTAQSLEYISDHGCVAVHRSLREHYHRLAFHSEWWSQRGHHHYILYEMPPLGAL